MKYTGHCFLRFAHSRWLHGPTIDNKDGEIHEVKMRLQTRAPYRQRTSLRPLSPVLSRWSTRLLPIPRKPSLSRSVQPWPGMDTSAGRPGDRGTRVPSKGTKRDLQIHERTVGPEAGYVFRTTSHCPSKTYPRSDEFYLALERSTFIADVRTLRWPGLNFGLLMVKTGQ
jgi:hypothetical protein